MKMGAGATTGTPHFGYYLTPLDTLTHLYQQGGIVTVTSGVSVTVVDFYTLTQAPVGCREGDDSIGGGVNR